MSEQDEKEDVSVVTFLNEEAAKALKDAQKKLSEVVRKSAEYRLSLPPLILPPVDPDDVPTDPDLKTDLEPVPEDLKSKD